MIYLKTCYPSLLLVSCICINWNIFDSFLFILYPIWSPKVLFAEKVHFIVRYMHMYTKSENVFCLTQFNYKIYNVHDSFLYNKGHCINIVLLNNFIRILISFLLPLGSTFPGEVQVWEYHRPTDETHWLSPRSLYGKCRQKEKSITITSL